MCAWGWVYKCLHTEFNRIFILPWYWWSVVHVLSILGHSSGFEKCRRHALWEIIASNILHGRLVAITLQCTDESWWPQGSPVIVLCWPCSSCHHLYGASRDKSGNTRVKRADDSTFSLFGPFNYKLRAASTTKISIYINIYICVCVCVCSEYSCSDTLKSCWRFLRVTVT